MRRSTEEYIVTAIFVAIALLAIWVTYRSAQNCARRDGALVRGALWYECVEKAHDAR